MALEMFTAGHPTCNYVCDICIISCGFNKLRKNAPMQQARRFTMWARQDTCTRTCGTTSPETCFSAACYGMNLKQMQVPSPIDPSPVNRESDRILSFRRTQKIKDCVYRGPE
jgi:hypothetical protein